MNNSVASSGILPELSFRNSVKSEYPESYYGFPLKDRENDKMCKPRDIKPENLK